MLKDIYTLITIDDHPLLRKGIADLIDMDDSLKLVGEAANGKDGIQLAKELNPDLILLDINMKGMNGLETLKRLKEEESVDSNVLMLTVSDNEDDVVTALRLGAGTEDVQLGFPVPIVTRRCPDRGHDVYRAFERYPVSGRCPVCGEKTYLLEAPREVTLEEADPISQTSLRHLNAPAGMRFAARTREGRKAMFHLPFRFQDVPALPTGSKP